MAKHENYDKSFARFILKNEDLINEYEDCLGESLYDIKYDILSECQSINNIVKTPTYQLLVDATRKAIDSEIGILEVLENIKSQSSINIDTNQSIQKYFKDINDIYIKNNNDYNIEYCEENRDKLIEMNLKSVIAIAKHFQGLGVPLEDLISAGNMGLVIAFEKYDPQKAKLKDDIINCLQTLPEEATTEDVLNSVKDYLTYGDVRQSFLESFEKGKKYNRSQIIKWAERNVRNATFNSVAYWWIEAYIRQEIADNGRLVRKPKVEIQKDKEKDGYYAKEKLVSMDAPVKDDSDTQMSEILDVQDDDPSDMDIEEAYKSFKENLNLLLDGVKSRDRSILLKKFGIGLPRPMEPKEIAEQEGLSIARVSQIFQTVIAQMQENQLKYHIDEQVMYDAISKFL